MIFTAAAALACVLGYVMRLKMRGVLKLIVSSLAGGAAILFLSAFNIVVLPFNFLTVATVGLLGVPGLGAVIAAALLL